MSKASRLSTSRAGRLSQIGRLAGSIAGGAIAEGARQLASGRRPAMQDLLLTPANARRVGDRLAEMRGAAMKVGQLLSMDSGHLLPPELSSALERLRGDACSLPIGQVNQVLKQSLGSDWQNHFRRFHFEPVAAASIGQVHDVERKDGTRLALKLQYPDIRRSIDSDVDNVASLLQWLRLTPEGMDIDPLLAEAKRQLHEEADYRIEASRLRAYRARLDGDRRYQVPEVHDDLSAETVLGMQYLAGDPIESLEDAGSELRNRVAGDLLELAFREVFDWGLVQSDPNFSNYLYDPRGQRIQLLDFGATRAYSAQERKGFRALLRASLDGSDTDVVREATAVGYLGEGDPSPYQAGIVGLLRTAIEPLRQPAFRFSNPALAQRMNELVMALRLEQRYTRLPPPSVLFLHRKLGGTYLLLSRLRATLPVRDLAAPWLA